MKLFLAAIICLLFAAFAQAEPYKYYQLDSLNPDEFRIVGPDRNQSGNIKWEPSTPPQKGDVVPEFNWNETGFLKEYHLGTEQFRIFNRELEQTGTKTDDPPKKEKQVIKKK